MVSIARKNLLHDRTRLAMGLGGILFAVILMIFAVGMMVGTLDYAVYLADHSQADIWVLSDKTDFFNLPAFEEAVARRVRRLPGVAASSSLIVGQLSATLRDGDAKQLYLVAFDPATGLGGPTILREGNLHDLDEEMTIILDRSAVDAFGPLRLGDELEINDLQVKIVGFTEGAVWMLGMPYAFTSVKTAQRLLNWQGQTTAVLVKLASSADPHRVYERLLHLDGVLVLPTAEARTRFRNAWLLETPAGYMSGAMVVIGFLVGLMMVGITLYTTTVEHLREFGVLKAIGAANRMIYRIVLEQALLLAGGGYALGVVGGLIVGRSYERGAGMAFSVPPVFLLAVFLFVLAMSMLAGLFAIRKVAKIDPLLVFKG